MRVLNLPAASLGLRGSWTPSRLTAQWGWQFSGMPSLLRRVLLRRWPPRQLRSAPAGRGLARRGTGGASGRVSTDSARRCFPLPPSSLGFSPTDTVAPSGLWLSPSLRWGWSVLGSLPFCLRRAFPLCLWFGGLIFHLRVVYGFVFLTPHPPRSPNWGSRTASPCGHQGYQEDIASKARQRNARMIASP